MINAYRGILNRINYALNSETISGMPEKIFDMALIWYHRPDEQVRGPPTHTHTWPTWSWAGWQDNVITQWAPEINKPKAASDSWVNNHAGKIEFWHRGVHGTDLKLVQTGAGDISNPPPPKFPQHISLHFLQFYTRVMRNPSITLRYSTAGEIWGKDGSLAGMVYYDGKAFIPHRDYVFAMLCRAPHGDENFDVTVWNATDDPLSDNDTPSTYADKPRISAKGKDLRWVMMLHWHDEGYYQRVGMGWVLQDLVDQFDWNPQWIVVH